MKSFFSISSIALLAVATASDRNHEPPLYHLRQLGSSSSSSGSGSKSSSKSSSKETVKHGEATKLEFKGSGLCLGVDDEDEGEKLRTFDCDDDETREFILTEDYQLQLEDEHLCLEGYHDEDDDTYYVQLAECDDGEDNQIWLVSRAPDEGEDPLYHLVNYGVCKVIEDIDEEEGKKVELKGLDLGGSDQLITGIPDGFFELTEETDY